MNQAKIWLVVNPSLGLPLLLGSVAAIALLVHLQLVSHTSWFGGYWNGKAGPAPVAANIETAR